MPGVLLVLTGADCKADGIKPIPHTPVPPTNFDMKLTAPGGGAGVRRPAHAAARRQGAPRRRGGGDGGGGDPRAGDGRRRSGRGRIRGAAVRRPHRGCAEARRARWCGTRSPDNVLVRHACSATRTTTDRAFAKAAHVVKAEFNIGRVTARADGAALVRSPTSTRRPARYTLYAGGGGAVRQKVELVRRARHRARQAARAVLRRRRQFRHAQPALSSSSAWCCGRRASSSAR